MARFSSRTTSVRFEDAAGTGMTAGPGPGDFSHGATNQNNAERIRVMDRNQFDGHVVGDDLEQEWSITIGQRNEALTSALAARINDFIHRRNFFSGLVSLSDNPDIFAFRVIVTMTLGGVTTTKTLPLCLADETFAEAKEGNTLAITGTNNGVIVEA